MNTPLRIVFIGSGNVAWHLAAALKRAGHDIVQVYGRTPENARALAQKVGADFTDRLAQINRQADLYVFAVKDDALPQIAAQMPRTSGVWAHTAGSVAMNVFEGRHPRFGVLYPLQTFSKGRAINFSEVPVFIEGNNARTEDFLLAAASQISENVRALPSEKRKYLHLAAVFACNFVNHLYALAEDLLEDEQIPFDVLKPLIAETAAKAMEISPRKAQTGPAARSDEEVMRNHRQLIGNERVCQIYSLLSESIGRGSGVKG